MLNFENFQAQLVRGRIVNGRRVNRFQLRASVDSADFGIEGDDLWSMKAYGSLNADGTGEQYNEQDQVLSNLQQDKGVGGRGKPWTLVQSISILIWRISVVTRWNTSVWCWRKTPGPRWSTLWNQKMAWPDVWSSVVKVSWFKNISSRNSNHMNLSSECQYLYLMI